MEDELKILEYCILSLTTGTFSSVYLYDSTGTKKFPEGNNDLKKALGILNDLGKDGWDVAGNTIYYTGAITGYSWTLKRETSS
jgi:hypothetical protein